MVYYQDTWLEIVDYVAQAFGGLQNAIDNASRPADAGVVPALSQITLKKLTVKVPPSHVSFPTAPMEPHVHTAPHVELRIEAVDLRQSIEMLKYSNDHKLALFESQWKVSVDHCCCTSSVNGESSQHTRASSFVDELGFATSTTARYFLPYSSLGLVASSSPEPCSEFDGVLPFSCHYKTSSQISNASINLSSQHLQAVAGVW